MRWLLRLGLGVLALALACAGAGYIYLRLSLPKVEGELKLAGLSAQVEVQRDRYGIPHIYARSL
jgi:penicillin amidase